MQSEEPRHQLRVSACVRQRGPGGGSRRGARVRPPPSRRTRRSCSAPLLQKTKSCPSVATLTRGRLCPAWCRPRRDLLAPAPSIPGQCSVSDQRSAWTHVLHTPCCNLDHGTTPQLYTTSQLHNFATRSIMNLSVDSSIVDPQQQQQPHNRQNLNLLLLHQMYQPLVSGEFIKYFYTCTILW